jgi:tricorn protease-like protein
MDWLPVYSPDGSQIAFTSSRSGDHEIWICESDGSSDRKVTSFGGPLTGFGSWSPDGTQFVFDSRINEGQSDLFMMGVLGGTPGQLTTDPADELSRIWSRDGKWIYFISRREDGYQLWRMPPDGKEDEAVRVTQEGAIGVCESLDGRYLYHTRWRTSGVWKMPSEGGPAIKVLDEGWGGLACGENGIYYLKRGAENGIFYFHDFETGESVKIFEKSGRGIQGMTLSPDGRFLLYGQYDHEARDLMLVEDFR